MDKDDLKKYLPEMFEKRTTYGEFLAWFLNLDISERNEFLARMDALIEVSEKETEFEEPGNEQELFSDESDYDSEISEESTEITVDIGYEITVENSDGSMEDYKITDSFGDNLFRAVSLTSAIETFFEKRVTEEGTFMVECFPQTGEDDLCFIENSDDIRDSDADDE